MVWIISIEFEKIPLTIVEGVDYRRFRDGRTDGQTDRRTDGQTDGRTDGRTDDATT